MSHQGDYVKIYVQKYTEEKRNRKRIEIYEKQKFILKNKNKLLQQHKLQMFLQG